MLASSNRMLEQGIVGSKEKFTINQLITFHEDFNTRCQEYKNANPQFETNLRHYLKPYKHFNKITKHADDAVIASITFSFVRNEHSSYDSIIRTTPQFSNGNIGLVYHVEPYSESLIAFEYFIRHPDIELGAFESIFGDIFKYIRTLPKDAVILNWECCSGCGFGRAFPGGNTENMRLFKAFIDSGFTVMFSDFALKTLAQYWDAEILQAPNPLLNIGEISGIVSFYFNPETMRNSKIGQFCAVGTMCELGVFSINASGGTIVYTFNKAVLASTDAYTAECLSVVGIKHRKNYEDSYKKPFQMESCCDQTPCIPDIFPTPKSVTVVPNGVIFEQMQDENPETVQTAEDEYNPFPLEHMKENDFLITVPKNAEETMQVYGSLGHSVLTFRNGNGRFIFNKAHFSNLSDIDVTRNGLLRAAENSMGYEASCEMARVMDETPALALPELMRNLSRAVTNSSSVASPCIDKP